MSGFTAAVDVNIHSPILLDVLTDKQQAPPHKRVVPDRLQPLPQDAVVTPKDSEWEEW
jgi:hypothetical protein